MGLVDVLTSLGEGLSTMFVKILSMLSTIFFTIDTSTKAIEVTPLGYLALIGLVLSIVIFLFNYVSKLIRGKK